MASGGTVPSGGKPSSGGKTNGGSGGSEPQAGSTSGGTAGASGWEMPRGACEQSERVGRFSVEKQKEFGVVQGNVSEAVVPTSIPELVLEQAGCRLLKRRNLACLPACVGTETCGEEGKCIAYPRQLSVGEVTISGLTKAVSMMPQKPGAVYFAPGQDNPPFEADSAVVLRATGDGDIGELTLFGSGSDPLDESPTWQLERDQDLALSWAKPKAAAATQVVVEITIDQHGMSPLSVSCELEDTGSGAIPKAIVNQLIDSGVSGFPNGRILRRTADHVALDFGCVELSVGSTLAATVSVSGFTPCKKPADCPDGQTCNTVLERCE